MVHYLCEKFYKIVRNIYVFGQIINFLINKNKYIMKKLDKTRPFLAVKALKLKLKKMGK